MNPRHKVHFVTDFKGYFNKNYFHVHLKCILSSIRRHIAIFVCVDLLVSSLVIPSHNSQVARLLCGVSVIVFQVRPIVPEKHLGPFMPHLPG